METNINEKLSKLEQTVHLMKMKDVRNDMAKDAMLHLYNELKGKYDNIQIEMKEIKARLATK
ncbi:MULTISPECIES: hypothetical protein [Paenibacillus]|uniref:hypothetical protein n=1 Tax=Paenibacillus TaxID=44249 RepID=UPI00289B4A38|nr:hypothetical protein [Paenibacillus odorifer]